MSQIKRGFEFVPYLISLLITLSIGAVAGFFTTSQIRVWYVYLKKPSFNPPNWLFAPVWTILYIMIATAAYLVWKKRHIGKAYNRARTTYLIQLFFNFSWSIVFFGLHQVFAALIVISLLLILIVINISQFSNFSKTASWLLVPYLLWVGFACVLNLSIWLMNQRVI